MPSSSQLRQFILPAIILLIGLVCSGLLFVGSGISPEEAKALRSTARHNGWHEWPATFGSTEAATIYTHALPVGGRVDEVRIGLRSYLVIFAHGSGKIGRAHV